MEQHIPFILVSILLFLLPLIAARNLLVPAITLLSFLIISLPLYYGFDTLCIIVIAFLVALLSLSVWMAKRRGIFRIESDKELKKWRIFARPFALMFIPINIYIGHTFLIYLLGGLSSIFILIDLYRLIFRYNLSLLFKKTETQRFSSMTSFIVAIFIVFLIFPVNIAYLCLAFITFGDMASKFTGIKYGRKKLIQTRTLEGSLGFLSACLFTGYLLVLIFDIGSYYLVIGAACATLAELFSYSLDDNFTVSILTGTCLYALQYFQVI